MIFLIKSEIQWGITADLNLHHNGEHYFIEIITLPYSVPVKFHNDIEWYSILDWFKPQGFSSYYRRE